MKVKTPQMDNQFHIKEFYQLQGKVVALSQLFETQFKSLKELIDANFSAIAESTDKALAANDRRLEGMNEFRDALKDQTAKFITRIDFDNQHERVREDIKKLEISRAELASKATTESVIKIDRKTSLALFVTMGGVAVAVISLIITIMFKG